MLMTEDHFYSMKLSRHQSLAMKIHEKRVRFHLSFHKILFVGNSIINHKYSCLRHQKGDWAKYKVMIALIFITNFPRNMFIHDFLYIITGLWTEVCPSQPITFTEMA